MIVRRVARDYFLLEETVEAKMKMSNELPLFRHHHPNYYPPFWIHSAIAWIAPAADRPSSGDVPRHRKRDSIRPAYAPSLCARPHYPETVNRGGCQLPFA